MIKHLAQKVKRRIRNLIRRPQSREGSESFKLHNELVNHSWGLPREMHKFVLTPDYTKVVKELFDSAVWLSIEDDTASEAFLASHLRPETYNRLNAEYQYCDVRPWSGHMQELIRAARDEIFFALNSPFRVVQLRAWTTVPNASQFGPSDWHKDGLEPGHLKMMIYPLGLGGANGALALKTEHSPSQEEIIEGEEGLVIIFQNSDIEHRAIPPKDGGSRPTIEITLQRLFVQPQDDAPFIGTPNDRHLSDPRTAYQLRY